MEGFPSGQREQTVNLPAKPTEVRTLPPPPYDVLCGIGPSVSKDGGVDIKSGSSSVARASAFQAEGRGFESRFPLQLFGVRRQVLRGNSTDPEGYGMVEAQVVIAERVALWNDNRPT